MIDLKTYGYHGTEPHAARVCAVHKERYAIVAADGFGYARLKASRYYNDPTAVYPTVGDYVLLQPNPDGDSVITDTLPRKSLFSRNDFSGHAVGYVKTIREQAAAANFDYVFLVSSLNGDLNPGRLQRYLALGLATGAQPVIVLTKLDICPDPAPMVEAVRRVSNDVPIVALSAHTGEGMDGLAPYLQPGTTLVFLGMSGVGKSSLLNALAGSELMAVNRTRDVDQAKGRHTTTHRELFLLPSGAIVIDTPGMREIGMWDAREGVEAAFPDVEQFLGQCRFNNCRHDKEPGCAIRAAIQSGELSEKRWKDYQALCHESEFVLSRTAIVEKKKRFGRALAQYKRNCMVTEALEKRNR